MNNRASNAFSTSSLAFGERFLNETDNESVQFINNTRDQDDSNDDHRDSVPENMDALEFMSQTSQIISDT